MARVEDAAIVRFLEKTPLLRGVSTSSLDVIAEHVEVRRFRRRQLVWQPGDPSSKVYWVRSGVVRVSQATHEGRELTLHLFAKYRFLGEVEAFTSGPRETTAVAHEDLVLYCIDRLAFLRVLGEERNVAVRLVELLAARRQALNRRVTELVYNSAQARLAALFLELGEDFGVQDSRGLILNVKLTHREMASLIGATRETVSFAILDLRKDGYIMTESKRVVLLKPAELAELANPSES